MEETEEKQYSVYVHTNVLNGMKYVGCTRQKPSTRWGKDGTGYSNGQEKFYTAILDFGWENFTHEIIATNLTQKEAWDLEVKLIEKYNSVLNGYNSAYGGEFNHLSEASKLKLREQRLGEKNPNYNPNKIRQPRIKKSRIPHIPVEKPNYTFKPGEVSKDGRKSIEFSKRQSELKSGSGNPNYGKHTWCYGIRLTEDQKKKMIEAWTDERRELISKQKQGGKNCQAKGVLCVTTGKTYETIVAAAKDNNISERSVSECCNHKIKKVKGLSFVFIKEVTQNDSTRAS